MLPVVHHAARDHICMQLVDCSDWLPANYYSSLRSSSRAVDNARNIQVNTRWEISRPARTTSRWTSSVGHPDRMLLPLGSWFSVLMAPGCPLLRSRSALKCPSPRFNPHGIRDSRPKTCLRVGNTFQFLGRAAHGVQTSSKSKRNYVETVNTGRYHSHSHDKIMLSRRLLLTRSSYSTWRIFCGDK